MSDAGDPSWERVKDVFADALERPADERSAFLDTACDGDATLRREVESLLAAETTDYLERPLTEVFAPRLPALGDRLGHYRLVRVLGEGGMGRVFEAEQESPRRRVALKVLRPGFLGREAERRFQWEVEALARLAHPGIARVLEAGVEDAEGATPTPWFAMELVDGRPYLAAADALDLDRRARLALFLEVADALAHAHARGVIHRDIKPDNVLVDAEGHPHVLDFGIARAADPLASAVTVAGEIVGTLGFMAPEQLEADPTRIDARTDVYALGALLYRSLTRAEPVELEGLTLPAAAHRLTERDARPAGDHDPTLRGDLETILQKALERDSARRYATVEAFAADVRRYLADEPIAARPHSATYQLAKFARRHRGLVAGLVLAALALVVAAIGMGVWSVKASRARSAAEAAAARADEARDEAEAALAVAERERDRASDANSFLNRVLRSADPEVVGRDVRVLDLLESATAELAVDDTRDPVVEAALHHTLGETYRSLGVQEAARGHLEEAVAGLDASPEPADRWAATEAAAALAEVLVDLGELEPAEELIARVRSDAAADPDGPEWLPIRARELDGHMAWARGDARTQLAATTDVFRAWSDLRAPGDDEVEVARTNLANALTAAGRPSEARTLLEEGIRALEDRGLGVGTRALTKRINVAGLLVQEGDFVAADALTEELLPLVVQTFGPTHPKTLALRTSRASVVQQLGRLGDALELHVACEEASAEAHGPAHRETLIARHNTAINLLYLERFADADARLAQNLEHVATGDDPILLFQTRTARASALKGLGRPAEALPLAESALAGLIDLVGPDHQAVLIERNNLVALLLDLDDAERAVAVARDNLERARGAQPGNRMNEFPFRSNLGRALVRASDFDAGLAELEAVERFLADDPSAAARERLRIAELLQSSYAAAGRTEEAERWAEEVTRRAEAAGD